MKLDRFNKGISGEANMMSTIGRTLAIIVGVGILTIGTLTYARAEVTYRYNGLSTSDVQSALGPPNSCKKYTTSSEEVWYYGSITIRFKNGRVSECDILGSGRRSSTTNSPYTGIRQQPTSARSLGVGTFGTSIATNTSTGITSGQTKGSTRTIPSGAAALAKTVASGQSKPAQCTYLGKLSTNPYDPESIANPHGKYGSPYGNNLMNSYSKYGSPYSTTSWTNPYATNPPKVYAADGTYLGKLSTNRYDPESISNPYGRYGNPYGNTITNPHSKYGSPYSPLSWRNPYATNPPRICAEQK
ncbi:MAG: hypothetical protein QHI38_03630 [Armatimonadota bacterium]|nr:hypothetical protein [Armatimonadota bacterium]